MRILFPLNLTNSAENKDFLKHCLNAVRVFLVFGDIRCCAMWIDVPEYSPRHCPHKALTFLGVSGKSRIFPRYPVKWLLVPFEMARYSYSYIMLLGLDPTITPLDGAHPHCYTGAQAGIRIDKPVPSFLT